MNGKGNSVRERLQSVEEIAITLKESNETEHSNLQKSIDGHIQDGNLWRQQVSADLKELMNFRWKLIGISVGISGTISLLIAIIGIVIKFRHGV